MDTFEKRHGEHEVNVGHVHYRFAVYLASQTAGGEIFSHMDSCYDGDSGGCRGGVASSIASPLSC